MAVLNRRGFGGKPPPKKKPQQRYFAQLNLELAASVRLAWPAEERVSLARLS